jgi:hypothetical protein
MHPFMSRETTKGAGLQDMDIDGESHQWYPTHNSYNTTY